MYVHSNNKTNPTRRYSGIPLYIPLHICIYIYIYIYI